MVEAPIESPEHMNIPRSARIAQSYTDGGQPGIEAMFHEQKAYKDQERLTKQK